MQSAQDQVWLKMWKANAGWWIEEKISDTEFTMALQYLVKTGIITVNISKA